MDEGPPVVAKFYRPARWSEAAILEEHGFALELQAADVPVVAPLPGTDARTLHHHGGFRFALYPKRGGRAPELDRDDVLRRIGTFLARLHVVGARSRFEARERLDVQGFGRDSADWLLAAGVVPPELDPAYRAVAAQALEAAQACFERAGSVASLRLHGDCHGGNVLWTDQGPHFVDLDDARTGPAVQDLWMLLSGDAAAQSHQLSVVLEGYELFRSFDRAELQVIEALRTLRLMHYAAWLARRWDDPAFPASFPWFAGPRFWQDHVLALREQIALMSEPPLAVD
jgi:Ser/Thr protein kinase RdoA (MazF antagonist)